MFLFTYNICIPFCVVPTPNSVNVVAVSTQIVGQLLTLQCDITTVRGITSRVDIVWSSNGSELKRVDGANGSFIYNDSVVYVHSFDILQLNTSDDGRVYQCTVFVNTNPTVLNNDNITLDLTG